MKSARAMSRNTVVLLLLVLVPAMVGAQANPFFTPSDETTQKTTVSTGVADSRWYDGLVETQRRIQDFLSRTISAQRESGNIGGLLLLMGAAFAYGFLHALGPGHRKVVLSSYFISDRSALGSGVLTAFSVAFIHAGAALALVFGLYGLVTGPVMSRFNDLSINIERISYFVLIAIGCLLLVSHLVSHIRRRAGRAEGPAVRTGGRLAFIAASGAVPCPGAAAVLVFGIGNGAAGLAALAVVSMSLGMGTLLSVLVIATVLLRGTLVRRRSGPDAAGERGQGTPEASTDRSRSTLQKKLAAAVEPALEIAGALFIIAFGVLMVLPG